MFFFISHLSSFKLKRALLYILFTLISVYLVGCGVGSDIPPGNWDFTIYRGEMADPLNGYRIDDIDSELLPSNIDYSNYIPDAKSQGLTGSCTSWILGYYLKTHQEVVEEGWDKNINAFSPMYLFAMQCRNYLQPYSFIASYEILSRYGCPRYSTMPYEDYQLWYEPNIEKETYADINIPESIHVEARKFRCGEMIRLYNLNQVKQALTLTPILLAINYWSHPPLTLSSENNFIRYNPSANDDWHVLLCVGYDDSKFYDGALKVINSCGITWGENGYSWIKYCDFSKIIDFAMAINDMQNIKNIDSNITEKPESPCNVRASDNIGPYVDITWNKVHTARYYRIFRVKVNNPNTYTNLGISYKNRYRDYPEPGISYYYSVVSVNEIGDSEHYATDNETKEYVDQGTAKGKYMAKPIITWSSNDIHGRSFFKISNIDNSSTSMHVVVSNASEGPWHSFGWISPEDFRISWGRDSKYVGKKPYVRIQLCKADGYSSFSDSAQVNAPIFSPVAVASIPIFIGSIKSDAITLSWKTDNDKVDFFELWRYQAAEDEANDWILIDYASPNEFYYNDTQAMPGISYYYAIFSVYQGTYSNPKIAEIPIKIPTTQSNLFLYDFIYNEGHITSNPAQFELIVWNEGGTQITDYSIVILAYNCANNTTSKISSVFNASDIAEEGQLPLLPGEYHTLSFYFDIPPEFITGQLYSWGIWIDYLDTIHELYESDNFLKSCNVWWAFPEIFKQSSIKEKEESNNNNFSNTRPFSKKYNENFKFKKYIENVGPIPYKKPAFCNNHGSN